jgi:hypothetical protein
MEAFSSQVDGAEHRQENSQPILCSTELETIPVRRRLRMNRLLMRYRRQVSRRQGVCGRAAVRGIEPR